MGLNLNFMMIRNVAGNCRSLLSCGSVLPYHQQITKSSTKQSIEKQLGLPPKPKKPLTPYFRYMVQVRPTFMQKNPDVKATDIVKLVAKQWPNVDPALKQKYETDYKKDMNDYALIRLKYEESLTAEQRNEIKRVRLENVETKEKRKLKLKKKELGRPTKPMTGFLRFMQVKALERGEKPFREWQTAKAKEWEHLSEKEKLVYQAGSKEAMDVYKRDIQEWEEKMIRLGHIDMVRNEALIQPKDLPRKKNNE